MCVCHLSGCVDVRSLPEQQAHHVCVTLLGGQMQRTDPLLGQDLGLGPVLQQGQRYGRLFLLGCDVQRGVAVLDHGEQSVIPLSIDPWAIRLLFFISVQRF